MTPSPSILSRLSQVAGATAAPLVLVAGAVLAAPAAAAPTTLQPEDLPRGADISIPHIDDGDFVDGDRRVEIGGHHVTLIGRTGTSWLVGRSGSDGRSKMRIIRIKADDTTTVIKRGVSYFSARLSKNGRFLIVPGRPGRATPVKVFAARTGKLRAERGFAHYPQVLGMDGRRVLLSAWETGVSWWDIRTDTVTRVTARPANTADVRLDLLAVFTKDPYRGGCVKLTRLSSPGVKLWRSCTERIESISPDGERMATVDLLADGIGPGAVWERELDGALLGEYRTGWFGAIEFENRTDLLLEVNGETRASIVRCSEGECENASDPVPVQAPRVVAGQPRQNISVEKRVVSVKPTRS